MINLQALGGIGGDHPISIHRGTVKLLTMNRAIISSSIPLHIVPGVGCGGVLVLAEDEANSSKLSKEPEPKAPLSLDYPSNETDGGSP